MMLIATEDLSTGLCSTLDAISVISILVDQLLLAGNEDKGVVRSNLFTTIKRVIGEIAIVKP